MFECRFGHSPSESELVGIYNTEEEVNVAWHAFIKEHFPNVNIYYTRVWIVDRWTYCDYGSWTNYILYRKVDD